ncbi:uncharacterized protein [Pyxicephalus adspersus]
MWEKKHKSLANDDERCCCSQLGPLFMYKRRRSTRGKRHSVTDSSEKQRIVARDEHLPVVAMAQTEVAPAASKQAKAAPAAAKKSGKKKKNQPGKYSQLVVDTIRKLGERNGSSLAKIYNEAKKVSWFDQQNGRTYLKYSVKALVQNDTLLQVKGVGANGSFRLNKKKLEGLAVPKKAPAAKPAAKKPASTPKKSVKKAAKPSPKKAPAKPAAKSPNKVSSSKATKKVKKAAKPKALKAKKTK